MQNMRSMGTLREFIVKRIKNPEKAEAYLYAALDEYLEFRDVEALLLALRTITIAQGVEFLVDRAVVDKQGLESALSDNEDLCWETVEALFNGLGYKSIPMPIDRIIH